MPIPNKRAPQQEDVPIDATSTAIGPSGDIETASLTPTIEAATTTAADTVRDISTLTQSITESQITPTPTQSLSSGVFTILSQMTLAPSSSLPALSQSASGTVIRPLSSSVRPTIITPASGSSLNGGPNSLLLFTFILILFIRFFKH